MSDFEPIPADTTGADFQEGMLGREQLAPMPLGWFGGLHEGLTSGTISDAIGQQLLYGVATAGHILGHEGQAQRLQEHKYAAPIPTQDWEEKVRKAAQSLTPEPGTQGIATQGLAGLAGFATQVAMGGGGPGGILSVGATSAYEGFWNGKAEGLDDATAEKMGLAEGGSGALFAGLPFGSIARNSSLGVRLLSEIATGVGANVGIGTTSRYAQHKILQDAGYPVLAEEYKALDANSIMVGAATGLFPALHTALGAAVGKGAEGVRKAALLAAATRIAEENGKVRDALSVATDGRAQRERAPGIPVDATSAATHNVADRAALLQTLNKQGIDLTEAVGPEGATFVQPPQDREAMDAAREVFMNSLQEHLGADALDPDARRVAQALGIPVPDEETVRAEVPKREALPDDGVDPFADKPAEAPKPLPKRNMKTSDETQDSILEYLAKHAKGISSVEARAQGFDPADMNGPAAKVGIKRAFRKGGMTFDEAAERLSEAGYPVKDANGNYSPDKVIAALDSELRGKPVHSVANTRLALEDEATLLDRAEFDIKVPEEARLDPEEKDMTALETKARTLDNDRTSEIMESWEKDDPATIARVRRELQGVIDGAGQEGERGKGGERPAGSGGTQFGAEEEQPPAPAESLPTLSERQRHAPDTGTGAGFSPTGSDDGDRLAGRDSAVARQALADRPDAVIVDEDGRVHPAADAIDSAKALEDQAKLEADKAFNAAADCVRRQG